MAIEIGITTFVENTPDPFSGKTLAPEVRFQNLLEEIELADQLGLDVFGVGEHHRSDFLVSSPAVVLGAAASLTKQIRLCSAVSVLSSDDPVRVFQDFSTLDLLSNGRAEIIAGRGSFIESFPLFGDNLDDYNALFDEKLRLILEIRRAEKVTWSGKFRSAIKDRGIYPRPLQSPLPVWVGVGGSPESVHRAASLGLPMTVAIIGGEPKRFTPLTDYYHKIGAKCSLEEKDIKLCINSHGYIGTDSQAARDEFYPYYETMMSKIGRERGWSPLSRSQYDELCSPTGAVVAGSVQEVIDKILYEYELFKMDRFLIQFSVGTLPHSKLMKAIELFAEKVAPVVRKSTADHGKHI